MGDLIGTGGANAGGLRWDNDCLFQCNVIARLYRYVLDLLSLVLIECAAWAYDVNFETTQCPA